MNFKQQLIIAYDKDAKRRDGNESNRDVWKLDLREKFARLLKSENKKKILELGSGAGIDAKYFKSLGFEILATDISPEMVEVCKKRGLSAKVLDLYDISKLEQKFDGIYSMNVLLHVPSKDLSHVLREIHNVLNDDGLFFFGVYGGTDEEKIITDKTKMGLPRLFSFHSDKYLENAVYTLFEILDFVKVDVGSKKPNFYFQGLFLRKK